MLLCSDLNAGGLQRVVVNLSHGLMEQGHMEISCAVLHGGGAFRSLMPGRMSVHELNDTSQPLALLLPGSKLARCLRETGPDVLISFGHMTNLLAAWAKVLHGKKAGSFRLIASEHSTFRARMAGDSAFNQWRRIARARRLYRQADAVVCVSQGVADDLTGSGIVPPEKTRVIYNPVVDDGLISQMAREHIEHPWMQTQQDVPVFLAAGRMIPLKGFDVLLRAFHLLRTKLETRARLVFIGDGPERKNLETLAADLGLSEDVFFAGYQANPYAWMAAASCLVLSSRCEGFPGVLVEAMACGCNVVATDCPSGPREILDGGRWGRLVPLDDAICDNTDQPMGGGMAHAMKEALLHPLPSQELRQAALRFSVERSSTEWKSLIEEIFTGNFPGRRLQKDIN